jgi:hypothetical protein
LPAARLVVFGVLPIQPLGRELPPFAAKVAAVNERLRALAERHERLQFKGDSCIPSMAGKYVLPALLRVPVGLADRLLCPLLRAADCGRRFLQPNGTVDFSLMPDGVHPAGTCGGRCVRRGSLV